MRDRSNLRIFQNLVKGLACLSLGGCIGLSGHKAPAVTSADGLYIASYPADHRGSIIWNNPNGSEWVCAQSQPDVDQTRSDGIALDDGAIGSTLGFNDSTGAVSLGGRSPSVLMTRDLLYRACELSANTGQDPERAIAIYERFLTIIETVANAQTESGTQPISEQTMSVTANGQTDPDNNDTASDADGDNDNDESSDEEDDTSWSPGDDFESDS